MTRISSYSLYQCSSCGQKHILPIYGSINLRIGGWPELLSSDDLVVCQRCSSQKALKCFISLGILPVPKYDGSPKWYKLIRKFFDKDYKESAPHPSRLYPDLDKTPFDPVNYYPLWMRKNMTLEDFPDWFKELSNLK